MEQKLSNKQKTLIFSTEIILIIVTVVTLCLRDWDAMPTVWLFNISADMTCMITNLIFMIGTVNAKTPMGDEPKYFLSLLIADFFALFFDAFAWFVDAIPELIILNYFCNTCLYLCSAYLSYAFYNFIANTLIKRKNKNHALDTVILISFIIAALLRVTNLFTGIFFTVDANGVYARSDYYALAYVFPFMVQVIALIMAMQSDARDSKKLAAFTFSLFPFIMAVISGFIYGVSLQYSATLLAIMLMYGAFFKELREADAQIGDSLRRVTTKSVVENLWYPDGKAEKLESKNLAAVLVSDIRNYTALSENLEVDSVMKMINHFSMELVETAEKLGGIFIEYSGDGLAFVFPKNGENSDYVQNAVLAAIMMQMDMKDVNEWNVSQGYPEFEIGIGLHVGEVVLGNLGSTNKMRYTAIGHDVYIGHLIQENSTGGQILASRQLVDMVGVPVKTEYLCRIDDNSVWNSLYIYEITGIEGPYQLNCKRTYPEPVELPEPEKIHVAVFGKGNSNTCECDGMLLAFSTRKAVIRLTEKLKLHDDIEIILGDGRLYYAKVTGINENDTEITLTSAEMRTNNGK